MDTSPLQDPFGPVLELETPAEQTVPMVFASPHSGCRYPSEFLAQSALDPDALRRSEDSFVDELFRAAPLCGAPLLKALFPRAFVDANREPFELDPAMFDGPLPDYVTTDSPRISAGLGTIARVVATGSEIYSHKLPFAEAERRIEGFYRPYHAALSRLLDDTETRFGCSLLIDCHSMPSIGGPNDCDAGSSRLDVVLGDCFGTTCSALVIGTAESVLTNLGYNVVRNTPYAGGYSTRHYADPLRGRHTLQIEVNRRLYMNELTHVKKPGFVLLQQHLDLLVGALARLTASDLRP